MTMSKIMAEEHLPSRMTGKVKRVRTCATELWGAATLPLCEGSRNLSA